MIPIFALPLLRSIKSIIRYNANPRDIPRTIDARECLEAKIDFLFSTDQGYMYASPV